MDNSEIEELLGSYQNAINKLILLDYDGTLVKYELIPENAKLPEPLISILKRLKEKTDTKVFIISGRSHNDLDKLLGPLRINVISEHGSMIKVDGIWKNLITGNNSWKKSVLPIFFQTSASCPESFVEEKEYSLAWHYRNADSKIGTSFANILIRNLEKFVNHHNLKILDGNKVVEVTNKEIGKGNAIKKLIENTNYDFILSIGDDATDEEMFEFFLNTPNTFTVKVGIGNSFAKYYLPSFNEVGSLLKQLSK
jgi:trehalose 6-phosphate synthase/phosphatase